MAMRRYTRQEFEAELKSKWKLIPTEERTQTTQAWKTAGGQHILVPTLESGEMYPDHLIDRIVELLDSIKQNPLKR